MAGDEGGRRGSRVYLFVGWLEVAINVPIYNGMARLSL